MRRLVTAAAAAAVLAAVVAPAAGPSVAASAGAASTTAPPTTQSIGWADAAPAAGAAATAPTWRPTVPIPLAWRIRYSGQLVRTTSTGLTCSVASYARTTYRGVRYLTGATLSCRGSAAVGAHSYAVRIRKAGTTLSVVRRWSYTIAAPPPAAKGDPTAYAFLIAQPFAAPAPVTWNRCQPIGVTVNLGSAPASELTLVQTALDRAKAATGLDIRYLGPTDEVPRTTSPAWANGARIVLAITDPSGTDYPLGNGVVGYGGYSYQYSNRDPAFATYGYVVVDSATLTSLSGGADGLRSVLYLHELGHALGLAHVTDTLQVMYPSLNSAQLPAGYGAGDLNGLKVLGASPAAC